MKTKTTILLTFMILTFISNGQNIYKTAKDLIENNGQYDEKIGIKSGTIFNENVIYLKIGNQKQTLNKNEYYGYRDKNNLVYRFYNNQNYELLNPTEKIFIYRKKVLGGPKGNVSMYKYYFSLTPESNLIELTIHNVKTSFKSEIVLLEKIDLHFKNDKELVEFDSYTKKYKLNNVLG